MAREPDRTITFGEIILYSLLVQTKPANRIIEYQVSHLIHSFMAEAQ